jgi:phosphoserine aminotransferase
VLQEASEAVLDFNKTGVSILEIPHRGKQFVAVLEEANALVKELCGLDENHEVLWMQGGGRLQFCMIPMNFLNKEKTAGYIDSGHWAHEAAKAASFYGNTNIIASSREQHYNQLPTLAYLHYTTNNTIYGTQWKDAPNTSVPLIADMSSDFLSCQRNFRDYGMFYACAQKNIGPAGATLVVLRKDFLEKSNANLPDMLSYAQHVKQQSLLNTPPVFAVYVSLLMLRWTKTKSLSVLENTNNEKANLLYGELERNRLFTPNISDIQSRSKMNVCFKAIDEEAEKGFLNFAKNNNVEGIEGHRSAGGFRVSLYNAVSLEAVKKLIALMQEYEPVYLKQ